METARPVTLGNGHTVVLNAGDTLPLGLPPDFKLAFIPHDFIDSVPPTVFIYAFLGSVRQTVDLLRRRNAPTCARNARACIDKLMPRCWEVYFQQKGGDETATQAWQDFSNDVVIVASYMLMQGTSFRVILDPPPLQVIEDEQKTRYVSALYFHLTIDVLDTRLT